MPSASDPRSAKFRATVTGRRLLRAAPPRRAGSRAVDSPLCDAPRSGRKPRGVRDRNDSPTPRLPRTLPRPHAAPSLIPVHLIMTSSSRPRDPGTETQAWGRSTDNAPQSRMPRSLTRRPRFLPNAPTPHRPWRLPLLRAGPLGPHGLPKPCPRGRDGGEADSALQSGARHAADLPRLPGRKETGGGASSRLPASSEHQPLRGHCAAPTPPGPSGHSELWWVLNEP